MKRAYFHGNPNEFIVIERGEKAANSFGQQFIKWKRWAECRSWFTPMSALERFQAQAEHSAYAGVHRIRYVPDLQATDRVVWRGQVYAIKGITPLPPNRGYDILVELIK